MIFTVGLDAPTKTPIEVIKDCVYKIGNHYYITNSEKISAEDYSSIIKNASSSSTGKVFIDDWKASLNGTLQNYKEDVMTCVLGKFSILKLKIEIIVLL